MQREDVGVVLTVLDKMVKMGLLFDYYGALLTEKQQEIWKLYYYQDLSLGEIAERYSVSRQAVYDILQRTGNALEDFEEKLKIIEKTRRLNRLLTRLENALKSNEGKQPPDKELENILREIRDIF